MKLLNAQDTAEKIGKAKSTFFNYVTDGYFPQPKKNGLSSYWREEVVDAWIILSEGTKATLPPITVDDLLEIQSCIEKIKLKTAPQAI